MIYDSLGSYVENFFNSPLRCPNERRNVPTHTSDPELFVLFVCCTIWDPGPDSPWQGHQFIMRLKANLDHSMGGPLRTLALERVLELLAFFISQYKT